MKRQRLGIRQRRSYLLVEKHEYAGDGEIGVLQVGDCDVIMLGIMNCFVAGVGSRERGAP